MTNLKVSLCLLCASLCNSNKERMPLITAKNAKGLRRVRKENCYTKFYEENTKNHEEKIRKS
jgi:hypothetical protein